MGTRKPLAELERKIVEYVRFYRLEHGLGPTDAEGAAHFGWDSGWAFGYRVKKLIEAGYLTRGEGHRTLKVVDDNGPYAVRVFSHLSCGEPLQPEDGEAVVNLDGLLASPDVIFMRARGESMLDAHIAPGDLVAIRKTPEARSGEKVVARINGELTLKVLLVRGRGVKREYWLQPCNARYKPLRLKPDDDNEIVGVFAGVIRLAT